jgi:chaperonin GroEL
MAKILKFDQVALKAILKGIKTLTKAVAVTLGPKGRNVVINNDMDIPMSTKDGVSVAKEIVLKDKFENMGAQMVKEAASKTAEKAGDGTTTAIILAEAIFSEGVKNVTAGACPMSIRKGIDKAVEAVVNDLSQQSKSINTDDEVKQIAVISANNDVAIGEIIAQAIKKVGNDGIVTMGEAKGIDNSLDVVEGMQFDKGYISPYFITNAEKMSVELDNPFIFITDKKLSMAQEIVPILEKHNKTNGTSPLLIIAEDIEGEALATLVVNKIKGGMAVCGVKAPAFGDMRKSVLQDIAVITQATMITEDFGMTIEEVGVEVLGSAKKVKIGKDTTTIIDGNGGKKEIEERKSIIRSEIKKATSDYDMGKLEERLANLTGGVAVINIGAVTEVEMKEKKARMEDALHATRAAIAEGIVPGGGVALLRSLLSLDKIEVVGDEAVGVDILRKSLFAPITAIANNCGKQGGLIAEKVYEKKGPFGYNGLTDKFGDLAAMGVVDPVLVTKQAVINAASVSSVLLTISAMVTDKPQKNKTAMATPPAMDPMGGFGGGGFGGMPGMM